MGFRDMDLDDQVRGALRRNRELSSYRIEVNVRNGIVHLRGNVTSDARDQALQIVRGVEDIAVVVDDMSVV